MRGAWLLAAWLAVVPASAEDCARFAEPLAYNACLARQGPAARAAHVGPMPGARTARVRGTVTRRGRSEMVFSVRK